MWLGVGATKTVRRAESPNSGQGVPVVVPVLSGSGSVSRPEGQNRACGLTELRNYTEAVLCPVHDCDCGCDCDREGDNETQKVVVVLTSCSSLMHMRL